MRKSIFSLSKLKQLASQTALYGISTILVRSLSWLINPFHTHVFGANQSTVGIIVELYAYIAFINVILMYGMETAFFRYASKDQKNQDNVFSTAMVSLFATTSFFVTVIILFSQNIANILQYPDIKSIIMMLAFILGFDTLSNIPFAKLRLENKPMHYIGIKLLNVLISVGLNFFLLFPILKGNPSMFGLSLNPEHALYYVFTANLCASATTFLIFVPDFLNTKFKFCKRTWNDLMKYGLPLIIVGLAGIVNETIDRILLKYLLPQETLEERTAQVGIYGSVYKLAIFMSLVVQAYRMGAEPFFFKQAKDKDALQTIAKAMTLFVIMGLCIFLAVSFNLDLVILAVEKSYRIAKNIVPILLMAYLFLGIFYNLSVWYKLGDKTHYAMFISITGAIVTILINVLFIPKYGYWASAWATLASYFVMTIISWQWGKKHYPVPYELSKICAYIGFALILFGITKTLNFENLWTQGLFNNTLLLLFIAVAFLKDIKPMLIKR